MFSGSFPPFPLSSDTPGRLALLKKESRDDGKELEIIHSCFKKCEEGGGGGEPCCTGGAEQRQVELGPNGSYHGRLLVGQLATTTVEAPGMVAGAGRGEKARNKEEQVKKQKANRSKQAVQQGRVKEQG